MIGDQVLSQTRNAPARCAISAAAAMSVNFERRVGWRLDPDQFGVSADCFFERGKIGQINEIDRQLPARENATEETQNAMIGLDAARSRDR